MLQLTRQRPSCGCRWLLLACLPGLACGAAQTTVTPRLDVFSIGDRQEVDGALEGKWEWQAAPADGQQLDIELATRAGGAREQQAVDIRELSWSLAEDAWEVRSGLSRVFWGVTESRHLVDVINQVDLRFDPDGDVRLSQPLISLTHRSIGRTLTVFALPCYRPRPEALLLGDPPYDGYDDARFTPIRCGSPDHAIRAGFVHDSADIGVGYFNGHAREPFAGHSADDGGDNYPDVRRYSIDVQWTEGPWLLKAEGLLQHSHHGEDRASVLGVEYSLPSLFAGPSELSLLYEHLEDTRCASITLACGNMLGVRWLANDVGGTSALLSLVQDRASGAKGFKIELSRRLNDTISISFDSGELNGTFYSLFGLAYGF
ncbi:hypothetical protein ACSVIJ_12215 [Pseudomonas sp. NCHU5208]|uniref:hypothetical protein n=1 Tax=unclassified Pseudomonas TaxID=196821 RepID=UPI003F9D3015